MVLPTLKGYAGFRPGSMYEVETKVLNQAARRNKDRFPQDFMFRLIKEEWDFLRSQIVTLQKGKGKFPKYLPNAFTEHGLTMLASVLRIERRSHEYGYCQGFNKRDEFEFEISSTFINV